MQRIHHVGSVASLWRYPVKSMGGEEIDTSLINERGVLGDRAFAVLDRETGHVASAKHPRRWAALFACRAALAFEPQPGRPLPPVLITLPGGGAISSDERDVDRVLGRALGRDVSLITIAPPQPTREADRTPLDHPDHERVIMEEPMALASPAGTFFDYAPLHLITTATLDRFSDLHPAGRFDSRRFRPNVLVRVSDDVHEFVENGWIGKSLVVGAIELRVIDPSPRCIVTTLPQRDLPRDPGILRAIARNSAASATLAPGVVMPAVAGVYARIERGGWISRGAGAHLADGSDFQRERL